MPYAAEISRVNPACFLFLIDQSSSMIEPCAGQPGKSKAQGVADGINRLLQNLVLKCTKAGGVRDYFHVGVLGYGGRATWVLGGGLPGEQLLPISFVANNPTRIEERTRQVDDGAGGLVEQRFKFPVWFEPTAGGRTPMCQALATAGQAVTDFLNRFPRSYPPVVVNITDGKATDGDPEVPAAKLKALATADGNVLVFNAHLSSSPARPVEFPAQEGELSDAHARLLFRMSSPLPPRLQEAARAEGFRAGPATRGFVFNADLVSVVRFLDIGTRVAQVLR